MEQYLVSARKYRPSTFASVVGQRALTVTLKNAVATGRLAHSYLFCGSRGVGKTSCARIFAKTINCEHPTAEGEACNECDSCKAFNAGTSLNIIELDAASNNGVDAIRELVELTQNPPSAGKYRVFIVDEVHMLSTQAFNAFLKTLEEPPSYVVFILATTEKHKILPTILSRCQIYDFARISIQDIIDHLAYVAGVEGMQAETAALNVIARQADGAMRDALSIFDQVAASTMGNITYSATIASLNVLDYAYYNRLLDCALAGDVLGSWLIYKEIRDKGFDSLFFINGLGGYLRDLMVAQSPNTIHLVEAGDDTRRELQERARRCRPEFLSRAMSIINDADLNYRTATNKQFLTEVTLAKVCQLCSPSPDDGSRGEGPSRLQPIAAPAVEPDSAPAPAPVAATPAAAAPASAPRVEAPVTAHPAPPAPRKIPAGANPMAALRMGARPAVEKEAAKKATAALRTAPYTAESLVRAWEDFMADNPTQHILVQAMRVSPLQPVEGKEHHYTMTVENDGQLAIVQGAMPELCAYLRGKLGNDLIEIAVEVNRGESSPTVWNDRELLEHLKQTVPDLPNFISDFQLSIY